MNKGIIAQTFATDIIDTLSMRDKKKMLSLHFLSALSIRKQLDKNDKFVLITDSIGKELTNGFPYDEVITSLDNYPYIRPLKMSAYKLYSIELFKDKTFIHFDNDVYLFKKIPNFQDTLVQSDERGFNRFLYVNKIQFYQWKIFKDLINTESGYNPGVFGFTKDSIVREDYYKNFLKYSNMNIKKVLEMQGINKQVHLNNMQDIYLMLEEVLLYYVCKNKKIEPTFILPDRYKNIKNLWGTFKNGTFQNVNWEKIVKEQVYDWWSKKYCHLMVEKDNKKLLQEVHLKMYELYPTDILNYLKNNN